MRLRLASLIAVIALVASACNWSQGWHWPRTFSASGPSTFETTIYLEARPGLVSYQRTLVTFVSSAWSTHPELRLPVVDACPVGKNCIRFRTVDLAYPRVGYTPISFNSARHILTATVQLDPNVGSSKMSLTFARAVTGHETCHALGGGFDDKTTAGSEHFCGSDTGYPTGHDTEEIFRVYHDDPG